MKGFGGTMGQDHAGHPSYNPAGCPKVTKEMVRDFATKAGFQVQYGRLYDRMWYYRENEGVWRTLERTHFLALESLRRRFSVARPTHKPADGTKVRAR